MNVLESDHPARVNKIPTSKVINFSIIFYSFWDLSPKITLYFIFPPSSPVVWSVDSSMCIICFTPLHWVKGKRRRIRNKKITI